MVAVLVVAFAALALAVRSANEADRRTLAAAGAELSVTTTAPTGTPTSLGVAPTTTATTAAPSSPGTTGVAGALDAGDGLSLTGIGPVTVGMSVAEAQEAAQVPIGPVAGGGAPAGAACFEVGEPTDDPLVLLTVDDGVVSRIDVPGGSPVLTLSGVGIGSTRQDVLDTYGYRIAEEPHPDGAGAAQLRYVPDNPTHSLIFEVHDGVVTAFRSGFAEQVARAEGCS